MSLSLQTLSQEDLNLLRNDRIKFECGSLVYQTIIEWGFEKPDGVKIKDHFKNKKIEEKFDLKLGPWLKRNKEILEEEDFSSFDVTTLHDLLPVLCYDKVSQTGGKEWEVKLKDTNSIEYLLKEIKCFRNDVSHAYSKAKEDPNIEAKKELMRKCIRTGGILYDKDPIEIDVKVADLDVKFGELLHETSSYENAIKHVTDLIEKETAFFMLERYSPLFTVPLPCGFGNIHLPHIFQSVNLSVAIEDKGKTNDAEDATVQVIDDKKRKKKNFSSTEICNHVTERLVVINGGPGSGKTTLMKNLFQNILDNSVNGKEFSYDGIGRFRVPIYLECRTERQNNLRDFLKESIPNFKSPKEVIYDAFKEVEGLVFLVDGYDEVNDESKKLLRDIIDFCSKYNATCIVSGRVDAGNNLINNLKRKNLSYNEVLIEPISARKKKVSFLRRYGDKMGEDVDSEELVKSFENMNEAAQKVFFSPVLLALFISLFLNNRKSLFQLHNEQSAYKAIRGIFSNEIEEKLRESNVKNAELRTEDILALLYDYSLRLFRRKKYFFGQKDFLCLMRDCEKVLSKDVDIKKLLTCILTPETSLKLGKSLTYAFTHSTIQEYLAVGQIIKNMEKRKIDRKSDQISEDSLRKKFLDCVGVTITQDDDMEEVMRYGNIIKLLILETLSNGELTKYIKIFTAIIGKYFTQDLFNISFFPEYLLDLVYSSNCDSAIVSIVSNFLRDESVCVLRYTRYIRPLIELLKKRQTKITIGFDCDESLRTDTALANLGQLVLVLTDDSIIRFEFYHSYYNYQPLSEDFYTHLHSSKCKIETFDACVTSQDHLSIVIRNWIGSIMCISTVSACSFSFATLEGHIGRLFLRVKYTDDCPSTGSNPVTDGTNITITDIPADGSRKLYNILKYLCPKSKKFESIQLVNCHLTNSDTNELLKKLEREKIREEMGERNEVKQIRVNENKSRDLFLYLPETRQDIEHREVNEFAWRLLKQQSVAYQEARRRQQREYIIIFLMIVVGFIVQMLKDYDQNN